MKNPFKERRLKKETAISDARAYMERHEEKYRLTIKESIANKDAVEGFMNLLYAEKEIAAEVKRDQYGKRATVVFSKGELSAETAALLQKRRIKKELSADGTDYVVRMKLLKEEVVAAQKAIIKEHVEEIAKSRLRDTILEECGSRFAEDFSRAAALRLKATQPKPPRVQRKPGL